MTVTFPLFLSPRAGDEDGRRVAPLSPGATGASLPEELPEELPDREVVARVRGGDEEARAACEALYLEHAPRLIPFAYGYVRSRARAEEVVQDVFLSVWVRRREWAPKGGVAAYLYTAVRNQALKVVRHDVVVARREESIAREAPAAAAPAPNEGDVQALAAAAARAIAELPEPSREALALRRNHGLSFAEIGRVLGVSEDAARVRVARAERALRKALAPWLGA